MEIYPDAKMVDIKIVQVPCGWRGMAPESEIGTSQNQKFITLIHVVSGSEYSVEVPETVADTKEATALRAKAKLRFIHELHGEAWLNE